jgi:hypothetical protein
MSSRAPSCAYIIDIRSDAHAGVNKLRIMGAILVSAVLAAAHAGAHAHELCAAKVLQSELFPSAPLAIFPSVNYGAWLATATLEVRTSNAPPYIVTLRETLPWQATIRKGEVFEVPCQSAYSNALSLSALAKAPSFRRLDTRTAYYARVR